MAPPHDNNDDIIHFRYEMFNNKNNALIYVLSTILYSR